jgi:hypothetical protein
VSPTGRTLNHPRSLGFTVAVVEKWVPRIERRRDLWGFGDVLAVHPRDGLFLIVEATSACNVAHRLDKAKHRPELA